MNFNFYTDETHSGDICADYNSHINVDLAIADSNSPTLSGLGWKVGH